MGQRHQLFVIAKVKERYRGLAAIHHQWLYGLTALQTCRRLIRIFQDPKNRPLLEHEIENAATLAEEDWTAEVEWDDEPRFPFITTCLVIGAGVDLESGYSSNVSLECWNMLFDGGDNNDGITILDITRTSSVLYCFVHIHYWHELKPDINMTPLQGSEYLLTYCEKPTWDVTMEEAAASLDQLPLISIETLRETWPHGDFLPRANRGLLEPIITAPEPLTCSVSSGKALRSLTIQSMEAVIEKMLDDPDLDDEALQEVELLRSFQPRLRGYIYTHPNVVLDQPFGLAMLHRAFKDAGIKELDLRTLKALSTEHILDLLKSNGSTKLTLLDLSGNHNITVDGLDLILAKVSVEKTVYMEQ